MTSERLSPQIDACPLLGLPNDPRTHFAFAQEAHRCHATPKPTPIRLAYQGEVCLTRDFPNCELYRAWAEAAATRPGAAAIPVVAPIPRAEPAAPAPRYVPPAPPYAPPAPPYVPPAPPDAAPAPPYVPPAPPHAPPVLPAAPAPPATSDAPFQERLPFETRPLVAVTPWVSGAPPPSVPQRSPDPVRQPVSDAWPTARLAGGSADSPRSAPAASVPLPPAYPLARSAAVKQPLEPLRPEPAERPLGRRPERVAVKAGLILIAAAIALALASLVISRLGGGTPAASNGAALIATASPSASPSPVAPVVVVTPSPLPSESAAPTDQASPSPSGPPPFYIVQPGDSLDAIARRFGTTVARLKELNNIVDARKIVPGQKILLPTN